MPALLTILFNLLTSLAAWCRQLVFHFKLWKHRGLPRGPTPDPVIWNDEELDQDSTPGGEATFLKWMEEFGPTFSEEGQFSGRAGDRYDLSHLPGQHWIGGIGMINSRLGIFMTEGEHWRRHSAFVSATLHRFKESGFLERVVLDELKKLIQRLDTHSGQPQYDVMGEVMKAYADIIGRVLFGRVFTSTTELGILKEQVNCFFAVQGDVAPVLKSPSLLRPILCRLPRHSSAWQKFLDATSGVVSFIDVAIEERPSDEDCYAAAYMARQGQEEGSSFTHEQLRAECMDMLMPCLDDPIIQFGWGLAWALNSVWVMGWLEEEMQEVARSQGWSPDYLVCMADRTHLPRLWAFLEETNRIANPSVQNNLHRCTRDVVLDGHRLPKGTRIVPQISTALYDPVHFPDPHSFNPLRFLAKELGGYGQGGDSKMAFSLGSRKCPGMDLGRTELFLAFANLFRRYHFTPAPSGPPSLQRCKWPTVLVKTIPFECRVDWREL